MVTRLGPFWLLFVGIVWLLIAVWLLLVMSGISTPAVATWLLLVLYFAAPVALIAGAILLFRSRYRRIAAVLVLLASAYLTYIITPSYAAGANTLAICYCLTRPSAIPRAQRNSLKSIGFVR